MDTSIITAIIGAVAALCVPVVGVYATRWSRNRDLNAISNDRKLALQGQWVGSGTEDLGANNTGLPLENVSVEFKVSNKEVTGTMRFPPHTEKHLPPLELTMVGGFLYDRYLQLQYKNKTAAVMQFGSAVFELSASGAHLKGRFLGYGSITEGLVSGTLEFDKQL